VLATSGTLKERFPALFWKDGLHRGRKLFPLSAEKEDGEVKMQTTGGTEVTAKMLYATYRSTRTLLYIASLGVKSETKQIAFCLHVGACTLCEKKAFANLVGDSGRKEIGGEWEHEKKGGGGVDRHN
jgi:hypothetical protein